MRNLTSMALVILLLVSTAAVLTAPQVLSDTGGSTAVYQYPVRHIYQMAYPGIGGAACGPTSITMLLDYYFPNSGIDVPEVYNSGIQNFKYEGPAVSYAPVAADHLRHAGAHYLNTVWGGQSTSREAGLSEVISEIRDGPVILNVWHFWMKGGKEQRYGHYVVLTGYDSKGTASYTDDVFYVNDPAKAEPSTWDYTEFCRRRDGRSGILTFHPTLTKEQRKYTVVVDNSHVQLDDMEAKDDKGRYVWQRYYGGAPPPSSARGDWYYPKEGGRWAKWTPGLAVEGKYDLHVILWKDNSQSDVTYTIYGPDNSKLGQKVVAQKGTGWTEANLGVFSLKKGSYVKVDNVPANCNVDAIRFVYTGPAEPASSAVDVFMLVDLTGSFSPYLPAFKAQAPDLMANLKSSYPDVRFGLGKFEDYPIWPFGDAASGDKAYERLTDLTSDTDAVLSIINGLFTRYGGDGPESQLVALYQAATGEGQDLSGVGYPGASIPPGQQANFRDGAIKLFILWTDAPFHRPGDPGSIPYPGPSFDETVAAILALDPPMVIGISSGTGGLADLRAIAAATNAVAPPGGVDTNGDGIIDIPEGEPLVASIGYSAHGIAAAIESLISAAVMLPIASAGGPYTGEVGDTIVFDGSGSFDPDGWIVLYEWDFESDGVFDSSSAEPIAEHAYHAEFFGVATLRVTDNDGNTAIGTAPVEILPRSVIPVESVTVDPETLNLQAPAKWITAYIELPEEYAAEDIDVGTVQLIYDGSDLYADWGDVQDGVFMAKFDWATVAAWFEGLHDEEVELTVAGEVAGIEFEGAATIRVIDPSQRRG